MSIQALRELLNRLAPAATAVTALSALVEARATGTELDAELVGRIDDLLGALGAQRGVLDGVQPAEARQLAAELAINARFDGLMKENRAGWTHTDPDLLRAAGTVSSGFVQPLSRAIVPALEGLADRLASPGAAILDIGVGVAGLAIAMARHWPAVRIVGIDPWVPSLAIARDHVAAADLGDRIELREQRGEDLDDEGCFDFAWVPTNFISDRAMPRLLERTLRALRPGGWMLVSGVNPTLDPPLLALWRLRTALMGNGNMLAPTLEAQMRDAKIGDVQLLPSPPGSFLMLIAGRRPVA
jgi:predicted O-methyltransferase YrrM